MVTDAEQMDRNTELMLDGNALAGMLFDVFGSDVTASSCECAACGNHAELGSLLAFTQAPGAVLRCSACQAVAMRVVERSDAYYVETRGLAWLRIERSAEAIVSIPRARSRASTKGTRATG
jgi:uncharacterized protein DUF6510